MKKLLFLAILILVTHASLHSANQSTTQAKTYAPLIAAVTAADAERMAATVAGDRDRLNAILSDELRYAHSSGKVDSKASLIASLTGKRIVYESFDYKERNFLPAGPGVVLMTGRVLIHVISENKKIVADLNFLSVWREESGHWRFLSWQSCANPATPTAAK